MAAQGSSTKQLEQKLGFWDLMGSAVGQIIGAGIMSLLPAAMAVTGRSVVFSFLIAAIITCCGAIPFIFISSCVRLRGGSYTQLAVMGGKLLAGTQAITAIIGNLSLAMYGISLADYLCSLFGWGPEAVKPIALSVLTIFLLLNLFGVDAFAKVQNLLVIVLIFSLAMFGAFGIGKVQWGNYFNNADGYFMMAGVMGVCQASATLTFATGGGTVVLNFSAEAKNPTRDIPVVIIVSTLSVAVLYGFLSFVAAGVLPTEQVLGQNLTVVANSILPYPLYVLFIVGGAGCALASTLNNQLATSPKPLMQICDDGWLPAGLAKLNKKKVPYRILLMFYAVGVICILTGLSVSTLANMTKIIGAITTFTLAIGMTRIPKLFPGPWARSKFHVSNGVLYALSAIAFVAAVFSTYMSARNLGLKMVVLNLVMVAIAFGYSFFMKDKVHMEPSYEEVQ